MGMRRFAAVLVVAACAGVSARLWSDALTPTAAPFIEPFSAPSGLSGTPQIVVVAASEPQALAATPPTLRRSCGRRPCAASPSRGRSRLRGSCLRRRRPSPAATTPAAAGDPSEAAQGDSTRRHAGPGDSDAATPRAGTDPGPTPPAAAVPITPPVVQPVAPAAAAGPAARCGPSKPGNGYGDKNHTHTGPPGPKG